MARDEDSGTFRQEYTDEDFLDAVEKHSPASTSEVADEVGCTRRNADMRLKKLADDGKVKRKKIAASQVWTLVEVDE
ncbi:FaeA/PapI family transcriptional regulator [Halorientalis regularis]|uniref:FaeA/PapI family transcriptional regulator n=1 Tax=Halorientalis regularis TaxID=660518 RepID=UPI000B886B35|nr:FaeA/PapI family transcriptional regulator [Halorientalis regularis]